MHERYKAIENMFLIIEEPRATYKDDEHSIDIYCTINKRKYKQSMYLSIDGNMYPVGT